MARKALENLSESMFYVLMAFKKEELCGVEAVDIIDKISNGRVHLGPATLYTILGKFEKEGHLEEIAVDGRKRTYKLTGKGQELYQKELQRLEQCIKDAKCFGLEGGVDGEKKR